MNRYFRQLVVFIVLLFSAADSRAGLLDKLGSIVTNVVTNATSVSTTNSATAPAALNGLSSDQLTGGVKQALSNGVQRAVGELGHEGGFLTNLDVKIQMPERLKLVEKTLRSIKQDKLADDFVVSMNHAAEKAVPEATAVFAEAIQQMSIEDAKTILAGPNDAATQYFRRTTSTNLFQRLHPIVQQATASAGVTSTYKKMTAAVAGSNNTFTKGLSNLMGADAMDVDSYVTNKTLDGLFKMIADEEAKIRANPAARTTDLLQKVFGAAESR